jgi:uncharacterized membrane protein YeaQ/YmgE (transglycosylase-associated protein family)
MADYWRLKNIPELRSVVAKDRRECWREAVSRSNTARGMFAAVILMLAGGVLATVIATLVGYRNGSIHFGSLFVGIALAYIVNDHWLVQPRARQWLQAHVDSDGVYND